MRGVVCLPASSPVAAAAGDVFAELGAGRGLDARVAVAPARRPRRAAVGRLARGTVPLRRLPGQRFPAGPGSPRADQRHRRSCAVSGRDGALWISTNTGGLNRRDPRRERSPSFTTIPACQLPERRERLWDRRGCRGSVVGRHAARPEPARPGRPPVRAALPRARSRDSLANDWVYALHRGPTGTLWVGTVGGGLGRWTGTGDRFENFTLASLAGGPRGLDDVFAVHETADGQVWVGTRAGLVVLDPRQRKAERLDLTGVADEQPLVTTMRADSMGRLWVGSLGTRCVSIDTSTRQSERTHLGPPRRRETLSRACQHREYGAPTARRHLGPGRVSRAARDAPFRLLTAGPEDRGLRHENVTAVAPVTNQAGPGSGASAAARNVSTSRRVPSCRAAAIPARGFSVWCRKPRRDPGWRTLRRHDRGTLPACGGRQRARARCARRGRSGQHRAGLRPRIAVGRR